MALIMDLCQIMAMMYCLPDEDEEAKPEVHPANKTNRMSSNAFFDFF